MEFGNKHRNTLRRCVVLCVAVLLGLVVGVGVWPKLESRRADATIRPGNDSVLDALVAEHLSRLEAELALENRQVPASKREELLALSYKLQVQNLSQEERRRRALSLVQAEMTGQQNLYARLSLGSVAAPAKPRVAFGVGGAFMGMLAGFTLLFFVEIRSAEPHAQAVLQRPVAEVAAPLGTDALIPNVPGVGATTEPSPFLENKEKPDYVHELRDWSRMRGLHFGSSGDLSVLVSKVSESAVREDLSSLIRYIMYSENLKTSSVAILDLLSLAWTERNFSKVNITAQERDELIDFVGTAMKLHR